MATTPGGIPYIEPDTLDTIQQVNDAFLVIDGMVDPSIAVVRITGTAHTLTLTDNGRLILFDDAADCTLTAPEQATEALPEGFNVIARNKGGGALTLANEGTDTTTGGTSWTTPASAATVMLETAGTPSEWLTIGDLT